MALDIKPEIIKEIADYLDAGMLCFYHKTTGELIYFPEGLEDSDVADMWEDVTSKVDDNPDDYLEFEKMESRKAFWVMECFIDGIANLATRAKLLSAIAQKKPFANFNHTISYYPELRGDWFAYKNQTYIDFVNDRLERYNNMREFEDDE